MITWKQCGRSKFCTWHDHCEHAQHCNNSPNESAERDITNWQQFRPELTKNRSFWSDYHNKRNRGNKQSSPWALLFRCIVLFLLNTVCLSTSPCKGKYMWKIGELRVEELGSITPPMRPHNLPWYWFATHIPLRPIHTRVFAPRACSRGTLREQRSSVCTNDFMGILHPREQNFHPAKCSMTFNRLNVWEQAPGAKWANLLKTLPCVYWHVQNEPGACSRGKTPRVYRPLNKVHINSKRKKKQDQTASKPLSLWFFGVGKLSRVSLHHCFS